MKNKNFFFLFFVFSTVLASGAAWGKIYLFHLSIIPLIYGTAKDCLYGTRPFFQRFFSRDHLIFYVMIAWYSLSVFWAPNKTFAFYYIFYIVCGFLIVFFTSDKLNSLEAISPFLKIVSILFYIELAVATIESLTTWHLPFSPYSSYVTIFGRENACPSNELGHVYCMSNTATGFHWNPNDLATYLIMGLPFCLNQKRKILGILSACAISFIILQSNARAAMIGLMVIIVLCFFSFIVNKIPSKATRNTIIALVLIVTTLQILLSPDPVASRLRNTVASIIEFTKIPEFKKNRDYINGSLYIRYNLMSDALYSLQKTKGLGIGAGNSKSIREIYNLPQNTKQETSLHNFWLEIVTEGGLIFGLLFCYWYGKIIFQLHKISNPYLKNYAKPLFISMIAFVPTCIGSSSMIYQLHMWLMFGFAISLIRLSKKEPA